MSLLSSNKSLFNIKEMSKSVHEMVGEKASQITSSFNSRTIASKFDNFMSQNKLEDHAKKTFCGISNDAFGFLKNR